MSDDKSRKISIKRKRMRLPKEPQTVRELLTEKQHTSTAGPCLLRRQIDVLANPQTYLRSVYREQTFRGFENASRLGSATTSANLTVAESLEITRHRWWIVIPKPPQACFSINSTLYPSGSSTNAITVVPPFTGPASRETLPPASRMRLQAAAASSTSSAMWP